MIGHKARTVVSTFTGIGGFEQALQPHGVNVLATAEVDKYACKVYNVRHGHKNLGDVSEIDWEASFADVRRIDLLTGSPPCQDLSISVVCNRMGTERAGLDGSRSCLFFEFVRAIKELRPRQYIMENVNSMRRSDRDKITETLGTQPPAVLNASHVSAQHRIRLFWTSPGWVVPPLDGDGPRLSDILEDDGPRMSDKTLAYMDRLKNGRPRWKAGFTSFTSRPKSVCVTRCWYTGQPYGTLVDERNPLQKIERYFTVTETERLCGFPDGYTDVGISRTRRLMALGNAVHPDVVAHILKSW